MEKPKITQEQLIQISLKSGQFISIYDWIKVGFEKGYYNYVKQFYAKYPKNKHAQEMIEDELIKILYY